ncbi:MULTISPECIES: alanine racemase [Prochlorococcus]|uniref:Alanine racemase n=1 Tax=Prochlorococcus marinus str. MIT 9116 TaxID=167544 RepID=A0A0A1ZQD1_PROMR|nr:alanine racemase [Prochlorococcus marinus]KGF91335.1 Alanine racemase [Prochlorococcus marinus str. MIT 9107]KGF91802.1 Alanine racemase [Prochlorococcus marinus str. MIT 9116]KGF93909.1 Alanine racemase [Prochlorococcus marinus str. MIT 9123]
MQIRQTNQELNFDTYPTSEKDIDPKQRAWIEVRGKALETNVRELRSKLSKSCQFMAVVKADGYGHDAKVVSKYAIKGGASQLGVATLKEGIKLRSYGVKIPILILGNLHTKRDLIISFKNDLMPTISSIRDCLICNNIGKQFGSKFSLHLKVDTGMSRLGFECNKFVQQFEKIKSFENISIKGIYSHLSSADKQNALDPSSSAQLQKKKFQELLKQINVEKNQNIKIHLANSAGMLLNKDFHHQMVRVGLSMYGYSPLLKIDKNLSLKPALFLKVKVAFIRIIDKGVGVSYGGKFVSSRKTKLAVLSIGYADGVPRNLSGKMNVIHNNKFYPQVGSITMDQMMVDITGSNEIKIGSTMVLLGSDGDKTISPIDWARESNTIPWEILCSFKNRLPRVQVD